MGYREHRAAGIAVGAYHIHLSAVQQWFACRGRIKYAPPSVMP